MFYSPRTPRASKFRRRDDPLRMCGMPICRRLRRQTMPLASKTPSAEHLCTLQPRVNSDRLVLARLRSPGARRTFGTSSGLSAYRGCTSPHEHKGWPWAADPEVAHCVQSDVLLAAHRAQHRQCHPDGRRDRMRIASGRTARIRPVRTQVASRRPGLPRPGVGHRAPRSARRLGGPGADAGVRVHRACDDVVRRHRLPAGRRVDVRSRAHRAGCGDAGRPAHHARRCASRCWRAGGR